MSRRRILVSIGSLALIAPGCTLNSLLDQLEDEQAKTAEIVCGCAEIFPNHAECEANVGATDVTVRDRECTEDALAVDRKSSKATLECFLDVVRRYNDCLKDMFECPNVGLGCDDVFEELEACPELPADVDAELSKCSAD